jgi:hypothetical protein
LEWWIKSPGTGILILDTMKIGTCDYEIEHVASAVLKIMTHSKHLTCLFLSDEMIRVVSNHIHNVSNALTRLQLLKLIDHSRQLPYLREWNHIPRATIKGLLQAITAGTARDPSIIVRKLGADLSRWIEQFIGVA